MIGDYIAGSNHVLPTARSARFSSGFGVIDFMKRTSLLRLDRAALTALAPAAMVFEPDLRRGPRGAPPLGGDPARKSGARRAMSEAATPADTDKSRLVAITLDDKSIATTNPNIEHEREVAIFDILESNKFELEGRDDGPYALNLSIVEDRLVFAVAQEAGGESFTVVLSLTPLRRVMKDYFIVCESYYEAIRIAPPSRIQSIDMGRRGLHNEGSQVLTERLKGKITVDSDTARRLFTLICALHWKG